MSDDESKGNSKAYDAFAKALNDAGHALAEYEKYSDQDLLDVMKEVKVGVLDRGIVLKDFRKHFPLPTNTGTQLPVDTVHPALPRCPAAPLFVPFGRCAAVCFVAGGARPVAPSFRPLAVCLSLLSSVVPCVRVCCGVAMPRCFLFVTFGLSAPRPFCLSCRAVWPSGSN